MSEKELLNSKLTKLKLDMKLKKLKEDVGMIIQSLLFPADKYTPNEAMKWGAKYGFKTDKVSEPDDGKFIHLTQKMPGRFNIYKTFLIGKDVKARIAGSVASRFAGSLSIKGFSKFSKVKSDLDMTIPMEAELRFLCSGPNRDGELKMEDLEDSLDAWANMKIIDFHNLKDMKHPTDCKISDIKGYLGDEIRLENIDGKFWIISNAQIIDRSLAYHLYLKEQRGQPLEVSPEYGWTPYYINGKKYQTNLNPHLICIVDKGHIEGNQITVKSEFPE